MNSRRRVTTLSSGANMESKVAHRDTSATTSSSTHQQPRALSSTLLRVVLGVLLGAFLGHLLLRTPPQMIRPPSPSNNRRQQQHPVKPPKIDAAADPSIAQPPSLPPFEPKQKETHLEVEKEKMRKITSLALDDKELFTVPAHRSCKNPEGVFHYNGKKGGHGTIGYRDGTQKEWYKEGCSQWGLTGNWERRNRRIYYSFMFADEAEILNVVLHEIYPVVDVIIILECTTTWQGEKKPLFFPKLNQTSKSFKPFIDKIRYIPYTFDDPRTKGFLSRCMTEELAGKNWPPGMMQCRWIRQWGARDHLAVAAHDMRDHDVFVVADLDELLAREFLRAIHHCDVYPEGVPDAGDKCGRVGVFTFGHKYYFDCTVDRPHGHYHPNLALGRCLKVFGAEELKRWWGEPKKYWPKPEGLLETKMVGPGGWHLHSFLSTARVLWKWFSRSGRSAREHKGVWDNRWDQSDLDTIRNQRESCNEQKAFLSFDSEACQPLPHLIREHPADWAHYIRYVPDDQIPDEFGLQPWYHKRLLQKYDDSAGKFRGKW
eukprot:jgi/Bigna1/90318/estExt_fgenesh1_pg.C_670055